MRDQIQVDKDQSMAAAPIPTEPGSPERVLVQCISHAQSRMDLWAEFINSVGARRMAEIGVYRGDFAASVLRRCESLSTYYMIDPWRHLNDWNKPANHEDAVLGAYLEETKAKTDFAATRRIILRGKTTEVIDQITDGELDLAYIDGDHTLKGITIDLIRAYPKIRVDGFLCGDDFTRSVWEHKTSFEPTLVFPFAINFAEAVGATIFALPYSQFCIQKTSRQQFSFIDLTGHYDDVGLRNQFAPQKILKLIAGERFPRLIRVFRKLLAR
jgi:hypothetical protein